MTSQPLGWEISASLDCSVGIGSETCHRMYLPSALTVEEVMEARKLMEEYGDDVKYIHITKEELLVIKCIMMDKQTKGSMYIIPRRWW